MTNRRQKGVLGTGCRYSLDGRSFSQFLILSDWLMFDVGEKTNILGMAMLSEWVTRALSTVHVYIHLVWMMFASIQEFGSCGGARSRKLLMSYTCMPGD